MIWSRSINLAIFFAGLFVSGIFSGSLSTVSSAINSLAAVTLEDYIKPFTGFSKGCQKTERFIDENTSLVLKILAFCYGFLCVALTFLVDAMGSGMLQASLSIFGIVGGPLLGLFTLGMVVTWSNQLGKKTELRKTLLYFSNIFHFNII